MSECKICRNNGHPGVSIAWKNENGKFLPLELDQSTPHKHFQPNGHDNPVVTKTKTIPNFDSINFAETLSEVLQDYVRLKKQEISTKK